jgi:hypothetical protein
MNVYSSLLGNSQRANGLLCNVAVNTPLQQYRDFSVRSARSLYNASYKYNSFSFQLNAATFKSVLGIGVVTRYEGSTRMEYKRSACADVKCDWKIS